MTAQITFEIFLRTSAIVFLPKKIKAFPDLRAKIFDSLHLEILLSDFRRIDSSHSSTTQILWCQHFSVRRKRFFEA